MKSVDNIGQAIKQARIRNNCTQEELAEILDVTPAHVKHLESGHRKPSVELLFQIAEKFSMSVDEIIFSGDENGGGTKKKEIELMLRKCTEKEINVVHELLKALIQEYGD